jgi:hypothetical protein
MGESRLEIVGVEREQKERGRMSMELVAKMRREAQVVLVCAVLYLIVSFLDWQQVSITIFGQTATGGLTEWHGVGVVAALLCIALIVWEVVRALQVDVPIGSHGMVSVSLAVALLVFTVITFLSHNEARHWPAWVGLLLSIVITVAAVQRARNEGVAMSDFSSLASRGGDSGGEAAVVVPAAVVTEPPAEEPVAPEAPAPDAEEPAPGPEAEAPAAPAAEPEPEPAEEPPAESAPQQG